jgi:parallel beta-helix repeat protein/predicted outer membrane repeat protein
LLATSVQLARAWWKESGVLSRELTRLAALAVTLAIGLSGASVQTVIHVDDDAQLAGDGTDWSTAYRHLQDALAGAGAGDSIHVAGGVYKPDQDEGGNVTAGDRTATFQLMSGVRIYGGYAGLSDEDNPDRRDTDAYETILSGDLSGNDDPDPEMAPWNDPTRDDNAYHVVTGLATGDMAVLDSVTITAGNADAWDLDYSGGGMYNKSGSPTVTNCTFTGNSARSGGGGMYNDQYANNPALVNCRFTSNIARSSGGGMYNFYSDPILTNCTFSGNSAVWGGGVYQYGGNATLANCILWANHDLRGTDESAQIVIRSGSVAVTFTCIQGLDSLAGNGNIGDDPQFLDADGPDDIPGTKDDDLRLYPRSQCIDAGNNEAVPEDSTDLDGDTDQTELIPLDLDRGPRFIDTPCLGDTGNPHPDLPGLGIVDMGAYEYQELSDDDPDEDGVTGCADNCPLHWNADQADCSQDSLGDVCALALGVSEDCNSNGIPDECDIASDALSDNDDNGIPDECQRTILVDDDAALGGDGASWKTAYTYLRDALEAAHNGDEIRVAAGTYTPDLNEAGNVTPGNRYATFQLISGVEVYGGYAGFSGPDDPDRRDIDAYETILSGDLTRNDDLNPDDDPWEDPTRDDNSYHVLTASGTDDTAVLDGFTITGGNANGEESREIYGAGMYNLMGSLTIVNCRFDDNAAANSGAGIYSGGGEPTLTNCMFTGNSAKSGGGGMHDSLGSPSLLNCAFRGNSAGLFGAGVASISSTAQWTNCTFEGNTGAYRGGGMAAYGGTHTLINCAFSGNSARGYGGGMDSGSQTSLTLANCRFDNNSASEAGGAIYNQYTDATLIGCRFSGNSSRDGGAMYYFQGTVAILSNCTFTGNSADSGRGIACDSYNHDYPSTVEFDNCILWNGGGEIWNNDGSTIMVTYSSVQDEDPDDAVVYGGEGNIDDDPLFVPGPGGCFYLSQIAAGQAVRSPCIDAGSDTAANVGLDGLTTRSDEVVDTGVVDMGYHYPVTGQALIMGDFDRSGGVDLVDFTNWVDCMTGPGPAVVSPCCRIFDFEPDGDLDLKDFAAFRLGIPPS